MIKPRQVVEPLESRRLLSTYVVSPGGLDANPGTEAAPWRTLQRAADAVVAGDTVLVRPGDYQGFHLTRDGTAAARITFAAESGVRITSPNAFTTRDGINLEGADHVTVQGFTVNGMPRAGIRSVTNHHVTIRNNTADQNGTWGIFTGFSDDLLIEANRTSRSAAEHGIYVSNSADRPVVRGNIIWGNAGNGIHMNGDAEVGGGDGLIEGALVEGNVIYGNGARGGSGINGDGVVNSRIQNNLLYDNHASGISLYRINGAAGSTGNVVANNTISMAADARWALNIQNGSTGNVVFNNVLHNAHSFRGSVSISPDSLPGFASDHNVVMDRFTTDDGDTRLTLAQWRASTGQDQHSLVATPAALFVNPAANDYHLSATSPAVDRGVASFNGHAAPARDLEASARPSGAAHDIGAYERDTTAPTADIVDVVPDPRPDPVDTVQIVFSEPVSGMDLADLALSRDGGANLLAAGQQTVSSSDGGVTWTLAGLSGVTAASGNYALSLTAAGSGVADSAGNLMTNNVSDAFTVAAEAAAPPAVTAVAVNDGHAQRSKVSSLTVTFDRPVTLDAGAFTLAGRNGAGAGTSLASANPSGDGRTFVLTFGGAPVVGGSLADGVYDLTVVASKVHAADAPATTMAADHAFEFHRLFGDANGDGDADNGDAVQMGRTYNLTAADAGFLWYWDYNGDGDVDNGDVVQVRPRRALEFKGY
jgi:hypothetical protein